MTSTISDTPSTEGVCCCVSNVPVLLQQHASSSECDCAPSKSLDFCKHDASWKFCISKANCLGLTPWCWLAKLLTAVSIACILALSSSNDSQILTTIARRACTDTCYAIDFDCKSFWGVPKQKYSTLGVESSIAHWFSNICILKTRSMKEHRRGFWLCKPVAVKTLTVSALLHAAKLTVIQRHDRAIYVKNWKELHHNGVLHTISRQQT